MYLPLGRVVGINNFQEAGIKKSNLLTIISLAEGVSRFSVKAQYVWFVLHDLPSTLFV